MHFLHRSMIEEEAPKCVAERSPAVGFGRVVPLHLCTSHPSATFSTSSKVIEGGCPSTTHLLLKRTAPAPIPKFAYNFDPARRTWTEPCPANVPPRYLSESRSHRLDVGTWRRVFAYLPQPDLADTIIFVSRGWCDAVRSDNALNARRHAFNHTSDYDGRGILYYLGTMDTVRRPANTETSWAVEALPSANPATCLRPLVTVAMATLKGTVLGDVDLARTLCGGRPAHFSSDNVPFAWVGVNLNQFSVAVTAYTVSTSTDPQQPIPLQWELQGTRDEHGDWEECAWTVLDKRRGAFFVPGTPRGSHTFHITNPTAEPFRRLRLVQASANSHWGHAYVVSGLELYGSLHRKPVGRL
jgi:hypothetical protein